MEPPSKKVTIPCPKTIVLVQNQETDPKNQLLHQIEAFLKAHRLTYHTLVLPTRASEVRYEESTKPDLVLVLGGDGTFLRAAREFVTHQVPLIGVNTGHLGFLTRIESQRLNESLEAIVAGHTTVETRMMLSLGLAASKRAKVSGTVMALNDVVIKNTDPTRLAKVSVWIGEEPLADYDADGLIICSPTGSTAYNLSAGGPILDPRSEVVAITPICPHSLAAKPIVLPASVTIRLESDRRNTAPLVCAADGLEVFTVDPGQVVMVEQAQQALQLLSFGAGQESFFALLKRKLAWGANPRGLPKA